MINSVNSSSVAKEDHDAFNSFSRYLQSLGIVKS